MSINEDALIWIDLEIDGLDLTKNFILEIACIVTDFDLTNIHQGILYSYFLLIKYFLGPDLVINHSKSLLDAMRSWCTEHHTKSGFVQQVLDSKLSMSNAETVIIHCILTDKNLNIIDEIVDGKINDDLMKFVRRNQIYRERRLVVAGKSLGSIRSELKNLAPQFSEFCHYRSIDIDAISVSCEKWFLNIYKQRPFKNDNDLKNSIELLRFYHSTIFK
ncbi:unnamed protein product [Rotaria sp. Silwood2]|nr:unnamed protein product [Rotaria sp. Silwood2]